MNYQQNQNLDDAEARDPTRTIQGDQVFTWPYCGVFLIIAFPLSYSSEKCSLYH